MWRPPNVQKHRVDDTRWPTRADAERSLMFSPVTIGSIELAQRIGPGYGAVSDREWRGH